MRIACCLYALVLSVALVAVCAEPSRATCGDLNSSDSVTASDALVALRRAVKLPVTVLCPCENCTVTTTSSTTSITGDECFNQADCAENETRNFCRSYDAGSRCVECAHSDHCDDGESCRRESCGVFPPECADINLDHHVTAVDALTLVHLAVGNEVPIVCGCWNCSQ